MFVEFIYFQDFKENGSLYVLHGKWFCQQNKLTEQQSTLSCNYTYTGSTYMLIIKFENLNGFSNKWLKKNSGMGKIEVKIK